MADAVSDIKARLDIVDVVGQYVQLKKAGVNYKGLCPFHSEKSPSFVVSKEKQICHCFGCNKGGDMFKFIEEVEGCSFPEAMKILADRAGIKLEDRAAERSGVRADVKDMYYKAHDIAADFYEHCLHETNDGRKVLEYVYSRGVTPETVREFKLGFAPEDYDALYPKLVEKGISKEVMLKSGLVAAKNLASDSVYDKFRLRLMFPIFDQMGRVCGFGGRALKADQMPKYLNSPENPIYNKSRVLYGFSHAKQAIKDLGEAVLVEGYFDVILPHQVGVKNVVATSGTALTRDQAKLLKRFTGKVVSSFDTDGAGFEATKRAFFVLKEEDIFMKTIVAVGVKDPADYVKEHGAGFGDLIKEAEDFVSYYLKRLSGQYDATKVEERRTLLKEIIPFCKQMPPSEKDFYIRELARLLRMKEEALYDEIERFQLPHDHPARDLGSSASGSAASLKLEYDEILLAIFLAFPEVFEACKAECLESDFGAYTKAIYNVLVEHYNLRRDRLEFPEDVLDKVNFLSLYGEERYESYTNEVKVKAVKDLITRIRSRHRDEQHKDIGRLLREAQEANDMERVIDLLKRQQELLSDNN